MTATQAWSGSELGQVGGGRSLEDAAGGVESGAVQGAVPRAFRVVPGEDAAKMCAHSADGARVSVHGGAGGGAAVQPSDYAVALAGWELRQGVELGREPTCGGAAGRCV